MNPFYSFKDILTSFKIGYLNYHWHRLRQRYFNSEENMKLESNRTHQKARNWVKQEMQDHP